MEPLDDPMIHHHATMGEMVPHPKRGTIPGKFMEPVLRLFDAWRRCVSCRKALPLGHHLPVPGKWHGSLWYRPALVQGLCQHYKEVHRCAECSHKNWGVAHVLANNQMKDPAARATWANASQAQRATWYANSSHLDVEARSTAIEESVKESDEFKASSGGSEMGGEGGG